MKIKSKEERLKERRVTLIKNIIFIIILAIILYLLIYTFIIYPIFSGYHRDESLNVSYNLYKDLIPDPIQKSVNKETFTEKVRGVDINITKLAYYDITGKVEAIQNYSTNPISNMLSFKGTNVIDYISPIDLTLSWGEIALDKNSNHIASDQYYLNRDRVVQTTWDGVLASEFSRDFIISHFSNNHVISLDRGIRNEFSKVKVNQIVRIQGYLVKVECSNGITWGPSSLTRTDEGLHACEIIYVEKFLIMK